MSNDADGPRVQSLVLDLSRRGQTLYLFGPAQFFLDKVKVVSFWRGDEMEFKIAALDLDHIILHHQSPALAVECEEDFFF